MPYRSPGQGVFTGMMQAFNIATALKQMKINEELAEQKMELGELHIEYQRLVNEHYPHSQALKNVLLGEQISTERTRGKVLGAQAVTEGARAEVAQRTKEGAITAANAENRFKTMKAGVDMQTYQTEKDLLLDKQRTDNRRSEALASFDESRAEVAQATKGGAITATNAKNMFGAKKAIVDAENYELEQRLATQEQITKNKRARVDAMNVLYGQLMPAVRENDFAERVHRNLLSVMELAGYNGATEVFKQSGMPPEQVEQNVSTFGSRYAQLVTAIEHEFWDGPTALGNTSFSHFQNNPDGTITPILNVSRVEPENMEPWGDGKSYIAPATVNRGEAGGGDPEVVLKKEDVLKQGLQNAMAAQKLVEMKGENDAENERLKADEAAMRLVRMVARARGAEEALGVAAFWTNAMAGRDVSGGESTGDSEAEAGPDDKDLYLTQDQIFKATNTEDPVVKQGMLLAISNSLQQPEISINESDIVLEDGTKMTNEDFVNRVASNQQILAHSKGQHSIHPKFSLNAAIASAFTGRDAGQADTNLIPRDGFNALTFTAMNRDQFGALRGEILMAAGSVPADERGELIPGNIAEALQTDPAPMSEESEYRKSPDMNALNLMAYPQGDVLSGVVRESKAKHKKTPVRERGEIANMMFARLYQIYTQFAYLPKTILTEAYGSEGNGLVVRNLIEESFRGTQGNVQ